MKRGEIWTSATRGKYTSKPRPVVIIQDDRFDATDSITVCAFTSDGTEMPTFRLPVGPNHSNGLRVISWLMVDRISTVPRSSLRTRTGRLAEEDIIKLNRAILVFLGIAS